MSLVHSESIRCLRPRGRPATLALLAGGALVATASSPCRGCELERDDFQTADILDGACDAPILQSRGGDGGIKEKERTDKMEVLDIERLERCARGRARVSARCRVGNSTARLFSCGHKLFIAPRSANGSARRRFAPWGPTDASTQTHRHPVSAARCARKATRCCRRVGTI